MSPWYKDIKIQQKISIKMACGNSNITGTLLATEKMEEFFLSIQLDRVFVIVNTIVINELMLK